MTPMLLSIVSFPNIKTRSVVHVYSANLSALIHANKSAFSACILTLRK